MAIPEKKSASIPLKKQKAASRLRNKFTKGQTNETTLMNMKSSIRGSFKVSKLKKKSYAKGTMSPGKNSLRKKSVIPTRSNFQSSST
jgi:hypothetical protein